ncbi:hypothetical protein H9649_12645 [Sporosarcina sp. Sa2YVA2]|uniref:Uncharacterized protein n=1 Tax=Sporosarcina quadrami TaxID=2762234 RepID=A0ABR8UBR0_9BACL|nr:hypothetical protein [Sporosarcina quadrami]MBD7985441.1 hypothetical protein [Sporosarcina quadrami]
MKERYFWLALALIGISWITNSVYAQSKQLKEPIFLDHYIETTADDYNNLTFYYLANKNDQRHLNYFTINGLSAYAENEFIYLPDTPYNLQTFTHHVLRSKTINLSSIDFDYHYPDEDLIFSDVFAVFSDSTGINAAIGEVVIHPKEDNSISGDLPLMSTSSSMDTSGNSNYRYVATEPLTIEAISYPFYENLIEHISITSNRSGRSDSNSTDVNLEDIVYPIYLDKGQTLRINFKTREEKYIQNPIAFFLEISGTTKQEKAFTTSAWYNYQPYLTQSDVNSIIQAKTRRDAD